MELALQSADTAVCVRREVSLSDRTFNLGPCFVTTLVYKKKSVVRKTNNEHRIFLGPVMFHFDGKTDSYTAFFWPLSTVLGVHGVHTELMDDSHIILGSDEEKAIVNSTQLN